MRLEVATQTIPLLADEFTQQSGRTSTQQRLTPLTDPCTGLDRAFTQVHVGGIPQVLARVVDVQDAHHTRQVLSQLVPDPPRSVCQNRNRIGIAQSQPHRHPPPARTQLLARSDCRGNHLHMRFGQITLLPPFGSPNRRSPPAFGEDRKPHLPPSIGGVDHCSVCLELNVTIGCAKCLNRTQIVSLPIPHGPTVLVADSADGIVTNAKSTEFLEVVTGAIERPTGPSQAQQTLSLWTDKSTDSESFIERVVGT